MPTHRTLIASGVSFSFGLALATTGFVLTMLARAERTPIYEVRGFEPGQYRSITVGRSLDDPIITMGHGSFFRRRGPERLWVDIDSEHDTVSYSEDNGLRVLTRLEVAEADAVFESLGTSLESFLGDEKAARVRARGGHVRLTLSSSRGGCVFDQLSIMNAQARLEVASIESRLETETSTPAQE